MKKICTLLVLCLGFVVFPERMGAQEETPDIEVEQSAEVFLEDYSDDFQENFFEALKQKGIENYDKAINLLLKCKQLDPMNRVVDHELAKAYVLDKQYPLAQEHAVIALNSAPENPWYLDTLVEILMKQGSSIDLVASSIPYGNPKLKENLALNFFKRARYENALAILKAIKKSVFTEDLSSKINDSIEKREAENQTVSFKATTNHTGSSETNSLEGYKSKISGLFRIDSAPLLLQAAEEAVENYPSQPYFYYAQGYALNKSGKHRDAIEVLETALDYLVGDIALANKIYTELGEAYNGINNSVKANMYLRKIKPGF